MNPAKIVNNSESIDDKVLYRLGNPFDDIKIIFNTIMGSPRLNYVSNEFNDIIAKNNKDEDLFYVAKNIEIDHKYAESLLTLDHMSDFSDFGKLFNEFGIGSLNMIATSLMVTCGNKVPLCESNDFYSIKKLGISFNRFYKEYQKLIGIKDVDENGEYYSDDDQHLELSNFIDEIEYMIRNAKNNTFIEFGDILCASYVALTIYLTGVFIKISKDLGINMNTLYGEGNDFAIINISDTLIKSTTIENDKKYKLISLLYFYYLLTNFYQKNLGIDFVDKINYAFYKIGEKISTIDIKTLEEEMDISYILNQSEGIEILMNILNPPSVVTNPAAFDAVLRDEDITDFETIALPLYKYFSSNSMIRGGDLPKSTNFIYDHIINYENTDTNMVDILYAHFIDNVANVIPFSISPKYFYKITVYAAAFRKLKNSLNGKGKEIATLGLYQAEGIISLLYNEWVRNESYCREIGTGVCCKDLRYVAKLLKAKTYIKFSAQNYINFVHKFENDDDTYKRDNFSVYGMSIRILDDVNNSSDNFTEANNVFNEVDIMQYDIPFITSDNYQDFDEVVAKLNSGKISLLSLFTKEKEYGYNYLVEVIETDYQQKSMDQLSVYANNSENEYLSIYDCKLARALTNNIKDVIKNENAKERFDIYFNTFIKCVISITLAKNVMDKTDKSDEDFVGNVKKEEKYLPNIKSQRLFNFLEK